MEYRKHPGHLNDWHFHPHCPDWPLDEYFGRREPPALEELCLQCLEFQSSQTRERDVKNNL
jgi:hypothetical protein